MDITIEKAQEISKKVIVEIENSISPVFVRDKCAGILIEYGISINETHERVPYVISEPERKIIIENEIIDTQWKFQRPKDLSPLEKILFATLWKVGMENRIGSLVHGILSTDNHLPDSYVLFQLGKSMLDPASEPIIDQHVIRAFLFGKPELIDPEDDLEKIAKKHSYKNGYAEKYLTWIKDVVGNREQSVDFFYYIDKILFSLGRHIEAK